MTSTRDPIHHPLAQHTPYSDPGDLAGLLAAVPPDPATIGTAARNVIVHYREEQSVLPEGSRSDVNLRWLARTLATDQERHGTPLDRPRALTERVQGCCRDHALLACAVLRQHGIAARGRVGFARYFDDNGAAGFAYDHVLVEARLGGPRARWVRFDPAIPAPREGLDTPLDLPTGPDSPFPTAAEVWRSFRAGDVDPARFGAVPDTPLRGPWFIQQYVLRDLAHRHGDELLLWDSWGAMTDPRTPLPEDVLTLTDQVADLTVAADAGAPGAEEQLTALYTTRAGLRPGATVRRHDPFSPQEPPVVEDLTRPTG